MRKFKIEELDCAACANELESTLSKIDLISEVSISFRKVNCFL